MTQSRTENWLERGIITIYDLMNQKRFSEDD
jgi:hypothetical protein